VCHARSFTITNPSGRLYPVRKAISREVTTFVLIPVSLDVIVPFHAHDHYFIS